MIGNREHCSSSNPRSRDDSSWGLNSGGSARAPRKKKWVAPICYCGSHAILFMSGTVKNPDRLFFRCPKFKTEKWHCNFFSWLDDYVSSCGEDANKAVLFGASKQKQNRLEGHGYKVDNKVNELEKRLIGLEDQLDYCRLKMGESRCIRYGFDLLAFLSGVVIASLFRAICRITQPLTSLFSGLLVSLSRRSLPQPQALSPPISDFSLGLALTVSDRGSSSRSVSSLYRTLSPPSTFLRSLRRRQKKTEPASGPSGGGHCRLLASGHQFSWSASFTVTVSLPVAPLPRDRRRRGRSSKSRAGRRRRYLSRHRRTPTRAFPALVVAGSRGSRSRCASLRCRLLASSLAFSFLRSTRFGTTNSIDARIA